jgi:hypothetical protein
VCVLNVNPDRLRRKDWNFTREGAGWCARPPGRRAIWARQAPHLNEGTVGVTTARDGSARRVWRARGGHAAEGMLLGNCYIPLAYPFWGAVTCHAAEWS